MTTIFCNGHYLIADKRTSKRWPAAYRPKYATDGTIKGHYSHRDDSVKIILAQPEHPLMLNGETIVAYASSGAVRAIDAMSNFLNSKHNISLETYLDLMKVLRTDPQDSLRTIFLTSTGAYYNVFYGNRVREEMDQMTVSSHYHKLGDLTVIGSGAQYYESVVHRAKHKAPIQDLFLATVYQDRYSSCSYSVYGTEEKHLYTRIEPIDNYIQRTVEEVHALIPPYRGCKDRYYPFDER